MSRRLLVLESFVWAACQGNLQIWSIVAKFWRSVSRLIRYQRRSYLNCALNTTKVSTSDTHIIYRSNNYFCFFHFISLRKARFQDSRYSNIRIRSKQSVPNSENSSSSFCFHWKRFSKSFRNWNSLIMVFQISTLFERNTTNGFSLHQNELHIIWVE